MTNLDLEGHVLTGDKYHISLNQSEKILTSAFSFSFFTFKRLCGHERIVSRQTGKSVNLMLLLGHDNELQ